MNRKEKDDDENNNHNNNVGDEWMKKPTRQWSSCLKNPRIVRVSRGFGGKDRHSKVCTIRGLRDRRIRLSVPTAIQLYDLQDRLGLSQPSKVVDWLIDATKQEIEKLPPLPIIPTSFTTLLTHQQQQQQENEGFGGFHVQNFLPLNTHDEFSGPNFLHWEPPNLSLSQLGGAYSFGQHHSLSSTSLSSTSDQLYLSPSAAAITANPPFPSMEIINNVDHFRQIDNHDHHHFQNLQHQNSSLFPTTLHFMKSSTLSANSKDFFSQENGTDDGKQEEHKR